MATVVALLVAALAAALLSMTLSLNTVSFRGAEGDAALHVAESGIDDALFRMNSNLLAAGTSSVSGEVNAGRYTVAFDPPFSGHGEYTLTSTGIRPYDASSRAPGQSPRSGAEERRVIVAVVRARDSGPFRYGLFSDQLTAGAAGFDLLVDGYDSSLGSYMSQRTNVDSSGTLYARDTGSLASNGHIILTDLNVKVFGNVTPGPGKRLVAPRHSVMITGSTAPAAEDVVYEVPTYSPPELPSLGHHNGVNEDLTLTGGTRYDNFVVGGNSNVTLNGGRYRFENLFFSGHAPRTPSVMTIEGDVELFVDRNLILNGWALLRITPGSRLVIRHGMGQLRFQGLTPENQTQIPANFVIHSSTALDVYAASLSVCGSEGEYYGAIYAPQALVGVGQFGGKKLNFYGSMISKTLLAGPGFPGINLHYDEALAGTGRGSFEVVLWREPSVVGS